MTDQDANNPEILTDSEDEQEASTGLVLPQQTLPDKLYLIPVSNRPFFPAQIQPLVFSAQEWGETLHRVGQSPHKAVGLSFVGRIPGNDITSDDFPNVGCVVKIHNIVSDNDQVQFIALGMQRFKIRQWLRRRPPYLVQVEYIEPDDDDSDEVKAYALALIQAIKELIPLNPLYSEELKN